MASKTLVLLFLACVVAQGYATYNRINSPCSRDRNLCKSEAEERYYYETSGEKYNGRVNITCKNDRNQCHSLEDFKRYWGDDPQADASGYVPCKNDYNRCDSDEQAKRYWGNDYYQNSYHSWGFWPWF